jgi:hypothetical protein
MNNITPHLNATMQRLQTTKERRDKEKEEVRLQYQEQLAQVSNAHLIPDILKD